MDAAGNTGPSANHSWRVDTTAPTVTLATPPDGGQTNDPTPTFSGSAGNSQGDSDTVTVYVYEGDSTSGQLLQTLTTTQAGGSYSVDASLELADGEYTAQAEQTDSVGHTGLSTENTFTIDVGGIDLTPPTILLSVPASGSSTNDTTPTFAGTAGTHPGDLPAVTVNVYAGPDPSGILVQTLLTTAGAEGAYSVEAISPLPEGTYTGRAEQSDENDNTGFSVARTFTVDTTPPAATIDSHPSDPSDSASAAFSFSSNEGAATFRCALDGGAFTACSSPQPYSGLGEGPHAFQVKAEDAAGNIGDPASFGWTVDTVDPTTTIDSQPPNPSNSSTASFSFSANESGVSFECALDHGAFSVCTSPQAYTGLTDSAHSFEVRATDQAGNTGAGATYNWAIDTVAAGHHARHPGQRQFERQSETDVLGHGGHRVRRPDRRHREGLSGVHANRHARADAHHDAARRRSVLSPRGDSDTRHLYGAR